MNHVSSDVRDKDEGIGEFLPPAYVVRGKVIFILGNVCLFTIGGGIPCPRSDGGGGYPIPGQMVEEGTPSQVWMVGGRGVPHPRSDGGGGTLSQV